MTRHTRISRFLLIAALITVKFPQAAGAQSRSVSPEQKAAEAAIRAQETRWRGALRARDTASIGSFYTEDGVYAPQGSPAIHGRDSVSARWAQEFGIPGFQLERTPLRIDVASSGDLATEVGTYRVRYLSKKKPHEVGGTYMTAWRKVGDNWQAASYMWNRSSPE